MKFEIVNKLNKFLNEHSPFTEECQAVYLMVELRKLIEQDAKGGYRLVNFYCDWTVHPSKDKNKGFINEAEDIINEVLEAGNIGFLMPKFRKQMLSLFTKYGLTGKLCSDEEVWKYFVFYFVQVLVDQPIDKLKRNVSSFRYMPGYQDRIVVEVKYNDTGETKRFESEAIFNRVSDIRYSAIRETLTNRCL